MRFLVTGASGMVGHAIALYSQEKGHHVVGYCRRPAPVDNLVQGDLYDTKLLTEVIENGKFDVIVNAAGLLVADCEKDKDRAVYINAYIPHFLASVGNANGARLIQLSTDCIFKGNTGPYTEDSLPDGTKMYAKTKALGEVSYGNNLTLRNSVIGPDISVSGIGLLNWFMQQEGEVEGWEKAIWTGLTSIEIAKIIDYVADKNVSGLVNMVPENSINKFDLLQLFNKHLRDNEVNITKTDWFVSDKALTRTDFSLAWDMPSYEKMVCDMMAWINSHKDIYPPYYYRF